MAATPEVLILNGATDRETSGMDACDVAKAICKICLHDIAEDERERVRTTDLITDVIFLEDSTLRFPREW
jgi:hypothetical protein